MKVLKEHIRSIVITRIPFAIINSKGKMKDPFISSSASEQVVNALVNGIYEELSKLHQPTVSRQSELLFAFIKAIKEEFKDENWDYLDFIADRVIGKQ